MSSLLGHRIKSRASLHAEGNDVIETANGTLAMKKKFAEFNVGDEVEAVIKSKNTYGTFCDINAEKQVVISGPVPLKRLLKLQERVKAKIKTIDLEKLRVAIEIPDLEQLVQDRMETLKKFEEFKVGDEVEAVIIARNRKGIFCDIKAEKSALLSAKMSLKKLLKIGEKVTAKFKSIDLEKRQVAIEIPDLEQLVQGRSSPTLATPAQTKSKADGVEVKGGSINVDISGLELANVDVNYEKGTVQISVKSM